MNMLTSVTGQISSDNAVKFRVNILFYVWPLVIVVYLVLSAYLPQLPGPARAVHYFRAEMRQQCIVRRLGEEVWCVLFSVGYARFFAFCRVNWC